MVKRIVLVFLVLALLTGTALAEITLCPFDPIDAPEGVPAGTNVQAMTVGSVYGFSSVSQQNVWQTSGNGSGLQSNAFSAFSGSGTLNVMAQTSLSTKLFGVTSQSARAIEYQGSGLTMGDSSLFESISLIDPLSCERAISGARAIVSSGAYGSETLGMISPGNGIAVQQSIGTGEAAPVKPTGMIGTISIYSSSGQKYDGMSQQFSTSALFNGVSTIAHTFKFDTMTEA